jgi:hypothetical protein
MKSGEPVVQENDKTFSIEFPHPSATSVAQTPPRTDVAPYTKRAGQESEPNAAGSDQGRVLSEFKLDKMIWKGNRSF